MISWTRFAISTGNRTAVYPDNTSTLLIRYPEQCRRPSPSTTTHHSANPKLVEVGKLGTAASILEAEASSSIATENQRPIDFRTVSDSWHNTFCKMLTEGVTSYEVHGIFDNVSFISFNYDRVIEHYVCQWLCAYLRVDMETGNFSGVRRRAVGAVVV